MTGLLETQSPSAKTFWRPITPSQNLFTNRPKPKHFGYQSPPLAIIHAQPNHFWPSITPSRNLFQSPPAKTFWPSITQQPITPSQNIFDYQSPSFGCQSPPAKPFSPSITARQAFWLPTTTSQNILAVSCSQPTLFGYKSPLAKIAWLPIMLWQPKGQPIPRKYIIASKPNSSDQQPIFCQARVVTKKLASFASYHRQF